VKRVLYRPKAVADLKQVLSYSRKEWGDALAEDYLAGLEATCSSLGKFPRLGRQAGDYRRFRYERHVIFYRSERAQIIVVRILHERMVPKRHL
jgi:toxin ParE1/3/4